MILLLTTNTESGSVSTRSPSLPCIIKLEEHPPPVASSPNLTNYPNYRRGRIGHGRGQDERVLAVETSPLSSSGLAHRLDKGRIDPRCRLGFRPRSTRPEVTPGLFPGAVDSGSTPTVRGDSGSQGTHSVVFNSRPRGGDQQCYRAECPPTSLTRTYQA